MRLHIQQLCQAGTDGGTRKGRAGGRALQRDTRLGHGRGQRSSDEGEGERGLGDGSSRLAPGGSPGLMAVAAARAVVGVGVHCGGGDGGGGGVSRRARGES